MIIYRSVTTYFACLLFMFTLTGFDPASCDRPLTRSELQCLQSKHKILLNEICPDVPFLDSLFARHCISAQHKEAIENKARNISDQICELLKILRRRSFAQFQLFLSCLESTNQEHVRDVLQSPVGKSFDLFLELSC